jgi:hypothetical protein
LKSICIVKFALHLLSLTFDLTEGLSHTSPVLEIKVDSVNTLSGRNGRGKVLIGSVSLACESNDGCPTWKLPTSSLSFQPLRYMTVEWNLEPRFDLFKAISYAKVLVVHATTQKDVEKLPRTSPVPSAFREGSF